MKTSRNITIVAALLLLVSLSTNLFAQENRRGREGRFEPDRRNMGHPDDENRGPQRRAEGPGHHGQPREMFGMQLHEALRQLDLTEEQKEKVREILSSAADSRREAHKENADKIRQIREKMAQARKDWDREAFEDAQEELEELLGQRREELDEIKDELSEVLSSEQMKTLKKLMSPAGAFKRLLEAVNALDLEAAQKAKIKTIATETRKNAKNADSDREKVKAYAQGGRKIMDVLTEKQKRQLHSQTMNKARGHQQLMRLFTGLDLSEDQKKEIAEIIRDETSRLDGDKDRQNFRQVHRQIAERIIEEVLNDEQAEKFRENLKKMSRRQRGDEDGPRNRERPRRGRMRQSDEGGDEE